LRCFTAPRQKGWLEGFEVHEWRPIRCEVPRGSALAGRLPSRIDDAASSRTAATVSSTTLKRTAPKHVRAKETRLRESGFGPWIAPLVVIAAEIAVLGYLIRGSFFFVDDYQAFGLAHVEGLGSKLLFTPGYGNLAPTERFLHWFALSIAPMNYGVGEAIILVLTAAMLVALLWVLRELRADPVVTLAAIFFVGSSTIVLYEAFDFDQVVFLFPASACMLFVAALFIRWIRTGSTPVLVASWVLFGLSFFTQERLLILPIYLVIVRYLVLPYRMPPRGKTKPWADWRLWTPYAAIELAYYGYYRSLAEHHPPDFANTFSFFEQAGQMFVRVVFGLPLQGVPGWVTPVEWLAILGVFVAILVASRNKNRRKALLGATVFFVVAFAVNLFAVFQGVGGIYSTAQIVAVPANYLDPVLALAIAAGLATTPLASASQPTEELLLSESEQRTTASLRWPVVTGCAVLVALHVALLPFGMSNVLDSQSGQRLAASWVPTLRSSLSTADRARTPTTVLPLTMPAAFVPAFEAPFQLEQTFLPLLPEFRDSDRGSVSIIGPTGELRPAQALNSVTVTGPQIMRQLGQGSGLSTRVNASGETCFSGREAGGQFNIVLPRTVRGDQIAVDVRIKTTRPLTMIPFAVGPPQTVNALGVTVPADDRRLIVALDGTTSVKDVGFYDLNANVDFCLGGVQVAAVGVAASPSDGQCQNVDSYGSPLAKREPCGVAWQ
jgi:hypothetical protein